MINYNNGKIYKIEPIVEHEPHEIYFGSTTKEFLSQRMANHRDCYKRWKNEKYRKIRSFELFEKYGIDNCQITLMENYSCNSKDELTSKERYYISNYGCINKRIEGRTSKEYYADNTDKLQKYRDDNKEAMKEYFKNRYEQKKEEILQQQKEKLICECGCTIARGNMRDHIKTKKHNDLMKDINSNLI